MSLFKNGNSHYATREVLKITDFYNECLNFLAFHHNGLKGLVIAFPVGFSLYLLKFLALLKQQTNKNLHKTKLEQNLNSCNVFVSFSHFSYLLCLTYHRHG